MEWWQLKLNKPSFAVNDICWLMSLYFTTDHVTGKGNWPIQQVLYYLPVFFLVPPLTILTKHCIPFPWFQRLCLPGNIKAQENKVVPGKAANTHSMMHAEMCLEIAQPKRNQLTEEVISETVLLHAIWLIISPTKLFQTQKRLLFIFAFRFLEFSFPIFSSSTVS